MSLDQCLIRDEVTSRGFAGRLPKNLDLWTRQRPDALSQATESARAGQHSFNGWLAGKQKTNLYPIDLTQDAFQVQKAVSIKTN